MVEPLRSISPLTQSITRVVSNTFDLRAPVYAQCEVAKILNPNNGVFVDDGQFVIPDHRIYFGAQRRRPVAQGKELILCIKSVKIAGLEAELFECMVSGHKAGEQRS